jgi:hypothetical protein
MTQKPLDRTQLHSVLNQVSGVGVTQRVARDVLGNAGLAAGGLDALADRVGRYVSSHAGRWKQPRRRAILPPVDPQEFQGSLGQRHVAVLVALGVPDVDDHALAVDVFGSKCDGLRDPQAAAVHHHRAHSRFGALDSGQQTSDFLSAQDDRKGLAASDADQVQYGPVAFEGPLVEELDAEQSQANRVGRQQTAAYQLRKVVADVFLCKLVWRAPVVLGQGLDGLDIAYMRA